MKLLNEFLDNITTFKVIHVLLFVGIITFANALFNPFVWDDSAYILDNPLTQSFNFFNYFGNNIFNNSGQYRPLTIAYFALLHNLFGSIPFFFHFIQVLLHIINTCLLYILFKSVLNKRIAIFLGLIFLVHPMQVESVSYISSAGGALSFFFGMIALLLARSERNVSLTLLQYILLLSSVLVKESGILFFPLVIFYRWILRVKNIKKQIIYILSTAAIYLFIRIVIGNISIEGRPLIPIARLDFTERLINIPAVIFYYIKTFFYPSTLAIDQHWIVRHTTITDFYLPLILDFIFFTILLLLGVFIYRNRREIFSPYIFFCIWLVMGLAMYSQILPLDMTVADRWFYFGMAGILGFVGIFMQTFSKFVKNNNKTIIAILGILILVILMTRTIIRNYEWADYTRLYTHDISVSDNFLIQEEYAIDLVKDGKLNEALEPAKNSVEYFPHEENLYNLGYIYEELGNLEKAKKYYSQALQATNYTPGETHHNQNVYLRLARILVYSDDPNNSKKFIEEALKVYPNSDMLWLFLSLSEYKLQNKEAALAAVEHSYKLSPNNNMTRTVYYNLKNNLPINITFSK